MSLQTLTLTYIDEKNWQDQLDKFKGRGNMLWIRLFTERVFFDSWDCLTVTAQNCMGKAWESKGTFDKTVFCGKLNWIDRLTDKRPMTFGCSQSRALIIYYALVRSKLFIRIHVILIKIFRSQRKTSLLFWKFVQISH